MEFRCPNCQSPIYSRKSKICGVCEKPLPEELLLSDEQVAALMKQTEKEEKKANEFHLPDLHNPSSWFVSNS
jgi:predicted amidophosphoribosyltransferase